MWSYYKRVYILFINIKIHDEVIIFCTLSVVHPSTAITGSMNVYLSIVGRDSKGTVLSENNNSCGRMDNTPASHSGGLSSNLGPDTGYNH
jgi:hypothetical protein